MVGSVWINMVMVVCESFELQMSLSMFFTPSTPLRLKGMGNQQ